MWGQLIKARLTAGTEEEYAQVREEMMAVTPEGSGLVRATSMRDQDDPTLYYTLVIFESQEKARERENYPEVRAIMGEMAQLFEGRPEFVSFEVLSDWPPSS